MLFLAVALAMAASVQAITSEPDPELVCAEKGKCFRIATFYIIEPTKPIKDVDNVSLDFSIYNDNADPAFQSPDQCDIDWLYGTNEYPQKLTKCTRGEFSYFLDGYTAIEKTFFIEATHTVTVDGKATTFYARGKVNSDYIKCGTYMSTFKSCELKSTDVPGQTKEILLPIYKQEPAALP